MAYFLVPIAGDQARAAGLLALNGIQSVVADDGGLVARLAGPDPQTVLQHETPALAGASQCA
jgi:hypothetical protein